MEEIVNIGWLIAIVLVVTGVIGYLWLRLATPKTYEKLLKNIKKFDEPTLLMLAKVFGLVIITAFIIEIPIENQSLGQLWTLNFLFWIPYYLVMFMSNVKISKIGQFIIDSLKGPIWQFGVILFAIFTFSYSIYVGLLF